MAADTKANASIISQNQKQLVVPMTNYELLMFLNSDWIAKQNNTQQA